MNRFVFKSYIFDSVNLRATFDYSFEDGRNFREVVEFADASEDYNRVVLDKAMQLAFIIIGTSYYKTFPTNSVKLELPLDAWQSDFFNHVYHAGLGQFAFENNLTLSDLANFTATSDISSTPADYRGNEGILALQSGGKDSLLTAELLEKNNLAFESVYVSSGENHPDFLNSVGEKLHIIKRNIDRQALSEAEVDGAMNGHVPVTYIVQTIALLQAILLNKNIILTSIAHEGEEPHAVLNGVPITHQWSKTYAAEQDFASFVVKYIAADIKIGSLLRGFSELRVAELFVKYAWPKYGHLFSSCNVANYKQGSDNRKLKWCADCPKCANSYLLFAPFLSASELKEIFGGQDLFAKGSLADDFKGLLGIDDTMKPFECIGEIAELRLAYQLAQNRGDYATLPFDIPKEDYDYNTSYPSQGWTKDLVEF